MALVTVSFNVEGDAAAIDFLSHRPSDMPTDAVNKALEVLYAADDLAPYLYMVYNGSDCLGMLVAGNFNPENDIEIRMVWDGIVQQNRSAPLTGRLAPIQVQS